MDARVKPVAASVDYLLHLADNALVLGQRNAEWCGHAPILEEDLAMANQALDLIGQARLLYQLAATRLNAEGARMRPSAWPAGPVTEDTLAYFRDDRDFRNYTLQELPHNPGLVPAAGGTRDWGVSIVRNFFYAVLMEMVWERLAASPDADLAAIAAKSLKEVRYHVRHARDWLLRLGDGTDESHRRVQTAVDYLLPFTAEFWAASAVDAQAGDHQRPASWPEGNEDSASRVTVPRSGSDWISSFQPRCSHSRAISSRPIPPPILSPPPLASRA